MHLWETKKFAPRLEFEGVDRQRGRRDSRAVKNPRVLRATAEKDCDTTKYQRVRSLDIFAC